MPTGSGDVRFQGERKSRFGAVGTAIDRPPLLNSVRDQATEFRWDPVSMASSPVYRGPPLFDLRNGYSLGGSNVG